MNKFGVYSPGFATSKPCERDPLRNSFLIHRVGTNSVLLKLVRGLYINIRFMDTRVLSWQSSLTHGVLHRFM